MIDSQNRNHLYAIQPLVITENYLRFQITTIKNGTWHKIKAQSNLNSMENAIIIDFKGNFVNLMLH